MRVALVGAGAVGLGIASCLLRSGADVLLIARTAAACAALRARGVERTGFFGSYQAPPERVSSATSLDALAPFAPDFVLVCTKATASAELAPLLAACWGQLSREQPPALVLCQNGWGNVERFEAAGIPRDQIFAARVITGFRRSAPHRVEITVHAEPIHIGRLGGRLDASAETALGELAGAISGGGIPCEVSRSIEADLLAKLLYNCALNPLAALRGVPYGEIGRPGPSREILEQVVGEIFAVLDGSGLRTHWPTARDYLAFFDAELLPPTRGHEPSMLQDLRAGRRTEIDALCGAVVELGARAGVPTPTNAALAALIRASEASDSAAEGVGGFA